ncbi:MAG: hypothetical protein HFE78_03220 [Clostridiales bacterium]|nr:hypothetical protein [Clostridiales bacterium]
MWCAGSRGFKVAAKISVKAGKTVKYYIWGTTKIRPKVTKFIWGDIVDISISRVHCSEDRLLDIIGLFEYENVIIEIGDVEKDSLLFQTIKTLSINYTTSSSDDLPYTDVVLSINGCNLEELIHYIIASECESFSIERVGDHIEWEQHLHTRSNKRQLIKRKIIKLRIEVITNESQIDITFHKDTYNTKQVILKMKEWFCAD